VRVSGVIFDMDGTLVDSGLDFDQIRQEMGLGPEPILETMATMPEDRRAECQRILDRHEWEGAERATLLEGALDWIDFLDQAGLPRAIFTRNSRSITERTLERCGIPFEWIVAREDAPAKPDPAGIHLCCRAWDLPTQNVLMVGDYLYDVQAGRQARTKTALVTHGRDWHFASLADLQWHNLGEGLDWLREHIAGRGEVDSA
jgi:HAD superfamily hydrolase (TIGR01549 family)